MPNDFEEDPIEQAFAAFVRGEYAEATAPIPLSRPGQKSTSNAARLVVSVVLRPGGGMLSYCSA